MKASSRIREIEFFIDLDNPRSIEFLLKLNELLWKYNIVNFDNVEKSIKNIGLNIRTANVLCRAGVFTIEDAFNLLRLSTKKGVPMHYFIRNLGENGQKELEEKLGLVEING